MASRTSRGRGGGASVRRLPLLLAVIGVVVFGLSSAAAAPGPPPAGLTGISLAGQVGLSWSASPGRDRVLRLPRHDRDLDHDPGHTGRRQWRARRSPTAASSNNTTYYYAVRSITGGDRIGELVDGPDAPDRARVLDAATPSCSRTATRARLRWNVRNTATIAAGGIEGFATRRRASTRRQSVDLKVNSDDAATFRIEIYRTGYYGGARRAALLDHSRRAGHERSPAATTDDNTGLLDCSNWSVAATITTTAAWPIGRVPAAPRPRGHRHRQPDPAHRARRRAHRRDAALRRRRSRPTRPTTTTAASRSTTSTRSARTRSSRHPARGQGLVRPAVRAAAVRPARLVHATTSSRRSTGSSSEGYDVSVHLEHRPRQQRPRLARPQGVHLAGARRVLVGGHALRAEGSARRRRQPLLHAARTRSTGRSASRTARSPARRIASRSATSRPRAAAPDPSGIPTGTWRDPAGAEPARERAARARCTSATTTRRTSRSSSTPRRARTASTATPASTPSRPARRRDRPEPRRLGVGRARRPTASSLRA